MLGKIFLLLALSNVAFGGLYTSLGVDSSHYNQHSQSVDAGRRKVLDQLGTSSLPNYDYCASCAGVHGTLDLGLGLGGSSNSHSNSHYTSTQQRVPVIVPVNGGGGSESYQRYYEKRVQSDSTPIVLSHPSRGSESYQRNYEKHVQSQSLPITVVPNAGTSENYQRHYSNRIETENKPIFSGPEKYESSLSQKVVQSHLPVIYTPLEGSSSHSTYTQHEVSKSVPTIRYVPPASSNSEYSEYSSRKNTVSTIPVSVYPTGSSSSYTHNHGLSSSGTSYPTYYPTGSSGLNSNHLSSDSYTSNSWDKGFSSSSGLSNYMSESEKLARAQARNVRPGESRTGSSILGSEVNLNLGLPHLDTTSNSGSGYRSQSWEKSSKWESGTEYGPDGRPKSFDLLSTAESEQHNINGKAAGFKAATTTLNDNGKVSTYSLHT